jgi:hypothetical protein
MTLQQTIKVLGNTIQRCQAISKSGSQCGKAAVKGTLICSNHRSKPIEVEYKEPDIAAILQKPVVSANKRWEKIVGWMLTQLILPYKDKAKNT